MTFSSFPPHEAHLALKKINSDLSGLSKWARTNFLHMNPTKCQSILMGSKRMRQRVGDMVASLDGFDIPLCDSVRNLGVIIDSDLNFTSNTSHLCQKAYYRLKQLLPYKHYLESQTKILLCETLVLSHFNYADIVYGPCISQVDGQRLQKIQNLCIRFVTYVPPFSHVTPYLREFDCLKILERRFLHYAVFVSKIIRAGRPSYLFNKMSLRRAAHDLDLRHVDSTMTVPRHSTALFRSSFSYLSVYIFNNLRSELLNKSLPGLKKILKHLLLGDSLDLDISLF